MEGNYRFKPRGSVETADIRAQRSDFVNFLQVLPQLTQAYELNLALHMVEPPTSAAAPDRARLQAWSRRRQGAL